MKKLLVVAYHFPPSIEVGGIRPAKFTRYLHEFGWETIVLTIKEKNIHSIEPERLGEIENIRIYRASVWPTATEIFVRWKRKLLGRKNKIQSLHNLRNNFLNDNPKKHSPSFKLIFKAKQFMKSILELPDEQNGWLLPAIWKGYRLIKRENIDTIFATAPPETSLLVGHILSKLTGAKLVIDLRDPCFSIIFKELMHANKLANSIEQYIGEKIVHSAEKIITVTEELREYMINYYPGLKKEKISVIWNGYDKKDREELSESDEEKEDRDKKKFVISYIGRFYKGQNPSGFFIAIRDLLNEGFIYEENISLNFVGSAHYVKGELVKGEPIEEMVTRYNLGKITKITGHVPYKKAIKEMEKADILLVFSQTKHEYFIIPSKVFEILGLEKRILCFTTGGATYNFLKKTGGALMVDQDDPVAIKEAVQDLYLRWNRKDDIDYKVDTAIFERRALTEKLSCLLG